MFESTNQFIYLHNSRYSIGWNAVFVEKFWVDSLGGSASKQLGDKKTKVPKSVHLRYINV